MSSQLGCGGCHTLLGTTECYEKSAVVKAVCGFIAVPHDVYQRVCVGRAPDAVCGPSASLRRPCCGFSRPSRGVQRERVNPFIPAGDQRERTHAHCIHVTVDDSLVNMY